jgi:hypothetical protein
MRGAGKHDFVVAHAHMLSIQFSRFYEVFNYYGCKRSTTFRTDSGKDGFISFC